MKFMDQDQNTFTQNQKDIIFQSFQGIKPLQSQEKGGEIKKHTIVRGDTGKTLFEKYGVTASDIKDHNDIKFFREGQEIEIPSRELPKAQDGWGDDIPEAWEQFDNPISLIMEIQTPTLYQLIHHQLCFLKQLYQHFQINHIISCQLRINTYMIYLVINKQCRLPPNNSAGSNITGAMMANLKKEILYIGRMH